MSKKLDEFIDFLVLFVFPFGVISAIAIMAGIGLAVAIVDGVMKLMGLL